jgi:N-acetylglucosaminyl-diphospho-decaprenol L-rhamnosyltransferase
MAESAPAVTVVIVNYNGAHLLADCLGSLERQTLPRDQWKVVVVDNASTDSSVKLIQEQWPWVTVLPSTTNRGFAGGNNLALRALTTEFALLLNNDAYLRPDALERLLGAARSPGWGDVAAISPLILLAQRFRRDPLGKIRSSGGSFSADARGSIRLVNSSGNMVRTDGYGVDRGWLEPTDEHSPPDDVFGFCGAVALLRRAALEETGLFDDEFFMYYEDTDLSWRLRRRGWQIRFCRSAVAEHLHASSSVEGSAFFRFHDDRNRLLTLTKNASARLVLRAVLGYPLTTVSWMRAEWPDLAPTGVRVRVFASYLRHLPKTLTQRRHIERMSRISRADVERLLVSSTPAPLTPLRTLPPTMD